jgi:hypothetical protein
MDFCCDTLRSNSRRYYPKVPEAEQPDALVQYGPQGPEALWWIWLPQTQHHTMGINCCPWCGTELATLNP